ncbi:MAG: ParA family protein [Methylobacteriaceae bacterium]|nr:ParA family protein [Methylobacteriaceae bacterium]
MRTIAFVTQKGGSGKSTLASSIAVAAAEAGERVFIIDMDPQQSLVKWAKERGKTDVAVETVSPGKLKAVLAALEKKGVTVAVIDTPAGETPAGEAAVRLADLTIIPARPNAFDLWSSEATRRLIRSLRRDYAFLLNQCPPAQQSARIDEGVTALEAMGGLLSPPVSARVDYQEATRLGLGVTEFAPTGTAAQEIRKLWSSLRRRMARGAAGQRRAA